jgi:hypothetical protein
MHGWMAPDARGPRARNRKFDYSRTLICFNLHMYRN